MLSLDLRKDTALSRTAGDAPLLCYGFPSNTPLTFNFWAYSCEFWFL